MLIPSSGTIVPLFLYLQDELEKAGTQWMNVLPHFQPALLMVTLKLSEGALHYDPPLETVVASLNSVLDAFITQTSEVPQIASHVMHMLSLPEETLATIAGDDQALTDARNELNEMLDASLLKPRQLMMIFQARRYIFLARLLSTVPTCTCALAHSMRK